MATYNARPRTAGRAQRAWDVLAARYPAMQPAMLVSRLEDTRGWQWSMQFNSHDGTEVFWDSVSVAEIRELVSAEKKKKKTQPGKGLRIVQKNPKTKG